MPLSAAPLFQVDGAAERGAVAGIKATGPSCSVRTFTPGMMGFSGFGMVVRRGPRKLKARPGAIGLTLRRVSCYRARMRMTRPAPRRACARVRQLVAVWCGCVAWLSAGASVRAQVRTELERVLTVTRDLPGCVSASALRARTARYLGRAEQLSELTIVVDLQVPQFRVMRDGTLLAERRFARAPTECAERRDAVALALAIAIEQATENLAATSGSTASDTGPPPEAAERTADSRGGRNSDAQVATRPDADAAASARTVNKPNLAARGAARSEHMDVAGERAPGARARGSATPDGARAQRGRAHAATTAAEDASLPPLSAADTGEEGADRQLRSGRAGTRISVLGSGAVMFEALPTAAAAFSVGAELTVVPALRVGLSGLFSPPVSSSFEGGTVSAQLFGAQLTGCVNAPIFESLLLHGCAGAVGGVIEARGDDFALNLHDQMGWLAGLVRARLEFPAAGFVAAGVYADGRVNVLRPELQAGLASGPARTRAVSLWGAAVGVELIVRLH